MERDEHPPADKREGDGVLSAPEDARRPATSVETATDQDAEALRELASGTRALFGEFWHNLSPRRQKTVKRLGALTTIALAVAGGMVIGRNNSEISGEQAPLPIENFEPGAIQETIEPGIVIPTPISTEIETLDEGAINERSVERVEFSNDRIQETHVYIRTGEKIVVTKYADGRVEEVFYTPSGEAYYLQWEDSSDYFSFEDVFASVERLEITNDPEKDARLIIESLYQRVTWARCNPNEQRDPRYLYLAFANTDNWLYKLILDGYERGDSAICNQYHIYDIEIIEGSPHPIYGFEARYEFSIEGRDDRTLVVTTFEPKVTQVGRIHRIDHLAAIEEQ